MDYSPRLADKRVGHGSPVYLSTDSDLARTWVLSKYNQRVRISEGVLTPRPPVVSPRHLCGQTYLFWAILIA